MDLHSEPSRHPSDLPPDTPHAEDAQREFVQFNATLFGAATNITGRDKLNRPCRVYAPVGTHETLLAYLVRTNSHFIGIDHGVAKWGNRHASSFSTHGLDAVTQLVYLPAWVVAGIIATVLILLGRKRKPLIGYARD